MPAPLSADLRNRIALALASERPTTLARRFNVSPRSVFRLRKHLHEHGSTQPRAHGNGRPPHLTDQDKPFFLALLAEDVSMTHATMAERFAVATGRVVTRQTVQSHLKRWAITRKKNDGEPACESAKTS